MGSTVGPALAKELIRRLGNTGVAIQGVDYAATILVSRNPKSQKAKKQKHLLPNKTPAKPPFPPFS